MNFENEKYRKGNLKVRKQLLLFVTGIRKSYVYIPYV
jgi:hypothetical protein